MGEDERLRSLEGRRQLRAQNGGRRRGRRADFGRSRPPSVDEGFGAVARFQGKGRVRGADRIRKDLVIRGGDGVWRQKGPATERLGLAGAKGRPLPRDRRLALSGWDARRRGERGAGRGLRARASGWAGTGMCYRTERAILEGDQEGRRRRRGVDGRRCPRDGGGMDGRFSKLAPNWLQTGSA